MYIYIYIYVNITYIPGSPGCMRNIGRPRLDSKDMGIRCLYGSQALPNCQLYPFFWHTILKMFSQALSILRAFTMAKVGTWTSAIPRASAQANVGLCCSICSRLWLFRLVQCWPQKRKAFSDGRLARSPGNWQPTGSAQSTKTCLRCSSQAPLRMINMLSGNKPKGESHS